MRYLLLALTLVSTTAGARSWVGVNAGIVTGDVNVPCGSVEVGDGCSEGGMFTSLGGNLTFAGQAALRLRAIRANEDTDHMPYETAALLGLRLGKRSNWYGFVGPGRIMHADDDFQGIAHGMAWELVRAAPEQDGMGFEFSLYGNTGPDVDFTGIALGLRFGNLR